MIAVEETLVDSPNLLSGVHLREAVKRIMHGVNVSCAVAFWGIGSTELLPSAMCPNTRFVCNLSLGGTNPLEIKNLLERGLRIFQNNRLHAKIYSNSFEALVTSANASSNALGFSGSEPALIELGVLIPGEAARPVFEMIWQASRPISPKDIDAALKNYNGKALIDFDTSVNINSVSEFFGQSIRQAATIILDRAGQPLTTAQITQALREAGVETAARRLSESVGDGLRSAMEFGHFVRIKAPDGPISWALPSWPEYGGLAVKSRTLKPARPRSATKHADRTRAGLSSARARGVHLGRHPVMDEAMMAKAKKLIEEGESNSSIIEQIGVGKSTFYNWLKKSLQRGSE